MRTPELDVTFSLFRLNCSATEDNSTDEHYMWVLGFKVDAQTLNPPTPGSIFPSLGGHVFEGSPHFPNVLPSNQGAQGGQSYPIPANLGKRSFNLKPALLPIGG